MYECMTIISGCFCYNKYTYNMCVFMYVIFVKIGSNYQLCYNSVTSNSLSTDKEMGYDNKYFPNPSSQNHVYTFCILLCICIYVSIHISISSNLINSSIHLSVFKC